jgi:hypothetical protein
MVLWAFLCSFTLAAPTATIDWNAKLEQWSLLGFDSTHLTYVALKGKILEPQYVSDGESADEWRPITLKGAARQLAKDIHLVEVITPPSQSVLLGGERVLAVHEVTPDAWAFAQIWQASLFLLDEPLRPTSPTEDAEAILKIDPREQPPVDPPGLRHAAERFVKACLWHHLGARAEAVSFAALIPANDLSIIEPIILHRLADERYVTLFRHWAAHGDHQRLLAGIERLLATFPDPKVWQNRIEVESVRETLRQTTAQDKTTLSPRFRPWWLRLLAAHPPMGVRVRERSLGLYDIWWSLAAEWRAGMMDVTDLPLAKELGLTPAPHS